MEVIIIANYESALINCAVDTDGVSHIVTDSAVFSLVTHVFVLDLYVVCCVRQLSVSELSFSV